MVEVAGYANRDDLVLVRVGWNMCCAKPKVNATPLVSVQPPALTVEKHENRRDRENCRDRTRKTHGSLGSIRGAVVDA